ncbi:MAG: hypothetical protein R3F30_08350 [Planctomycetota bacterium]
MRSVLAVAVALSAVLSSAGAQSTTSKVIPPEVATTDGNSSSPYFSGYGAGIAQQVVASWAVCKANALINQVDLRADGANTGALSSRTFTNLKFYVGYATTTPSTMSSTFASNRGAVTKYIDAAYTLPAQVANARPFNIPFKLTSPFVYLPVKGDLLIEWEVPGMYSKGQYFFDAHNLKTSSGTATPFGTAGTFSKTSSYGVQGPATDKLVPGGSIEFNAYGVPSNNGSVAFLGFSRSQFGPLSLPFDLTPLGAPKNFLNVGIDLVLPLPLTAGKIGVFNGSAIVPVPNDNTLPGLHVYMQGAFVDTQANNFGLVFSQGVDFGLVAGTQPQQLVGTHDTQNSTGSLSPGYAHVLQLVGVFN